MLFAELALTAAFVIGLFIAYQLWFTNEVADSAAKSISGEIREGIKAQTFSSESAVIEVEVAGQPYTVSSLGLVYIPRLKNDVWATPILVGVGNRELSLGVGYYPGLPCPGRMATSHLRATEQPMANHLRDLKSYRLAIRSLFRLPRVGLSINCWRTKRSPIRQLGF